MQDIEAAYIQLGGQFVTPLHEIKEKLKGVKAFMFDWDGVFNNGSKSATGGSTFSEVDSMGTNLLRYSYYMNQKSLPLTAVISGEHNETAFYFSKRECFHYNFYKAATNKIDALNFICEKENITPKQVAYFFDDVLDLAMAEVCGLRVLVNQNANPIFIDHCVRHKYADYITANNGNNFAVRESTELLISLNGNYDQVVTGRKSTSEDYKEYLGHRRSVKTAFYTFENSLVKATEL
jgi:3-deoxy-D-manno-octulosonate 8-phosphate phosphatase (KDO 8-P phosphatase)